MSAVLRAGTVIEWWGIMSEVNDFLSLVLPTHDSNFYFSAILGAYVVVFMQR
jgi:hypothetical protein